MLSRQLASTSRVARAPLAAIASRPTSTSLAAHVGLRNYSSPASGLSEGHGKPTTSTAHPTVPHAPPKPTPFFARKNIGLEVTPLMAFVGTIVTLATGFLIENLITDDSIQHRHGVERDEALEKAISQPGGKAEEKK
ncbi:hypothetical protein JCM10213_004873 [Rhodosporidiobolus nylandii]